jgi:hypothetical protein
LYSEHSNYIPLRIEITKYIPSDALYSNAIPELEEPLKRGNTFYVDLSSTSGNSFEFKLTKVDEEHDSKVKIQIEGLDQRFMSFTQPVDR